MKKMGTELLRGVDHWGRYNTVRELLPVYKEINDLIADKAYEDVDRVLSTDVSKLSPVLLVGLARLTFLHKDQLNEWSPYVSRAKRELIRRDLYSPAVLKGLE
jgi:hypothetical protein